MPAKLKKGDKVIVLTGRDKGKQGEISQMLKSEGRAIVTGVNVFKKHQKPQQGKEGGIISVEKSIDLSNLAYVDPKEGGATRVGFKKNNEGKMVRFAKKSGELING